MAPRVSDPASVAKSRNGYEPRPQHNHLAGHGAIRPTTHCRAHAPPKAEHSRSLTTAVGVRSLFGPRLLQRESGRERCWPRRESPPLSEKLLHWRVPTKDEWVPDPRSIRTQTRGTHPRRTGERGHRPRAACSHTKLGTIRPVTATTLHCSRPSCRGTGKIQNGHVIVRR